MVRRRAAAVVLEEEVLRHGGLLVSWAAPVVALHLVKRSRSELLDMKSLVQSGRHGDRWAGICCYRWSGWFMRCCDGLFSRQQRTKSCPPDLSASVGPARIERSRAGLGCAWRSVDVAANMPGS